MPTDGLKRALDHLRHTLTPLEGQDFTDEELLSRFIADRDEKAFAALVRRHGAMVLALCRRVLGNHHDSEDAFQAAFLVLARKARTVIQRQAVAGWLYTVAYRIALQARAAKARRYQNERQVKDMPHPEVSPVEPRDWQPWLDLELSRLPVKYRTPVILCDLQGQTRKQVARQLRLREGTLSSRLATARRLLARRLVRHGILLSGGAVALALAEVNASAPVPLALVWSTAHGACLVAAGEWAAIAGPAAVLTKGAIKTMFLAKLKAALATLLVAGVLGTGSLVYCAAAGSGTVQAAAPQDKQDDPEALRKENELLKVNLRVTLEKIRAQETELATLKSQLAAARETKGGTWHSVIANRRGVVEIFEPRIWDLQYKVVTPNDQPRSYYRPVIKPPAETKTPDATQEVEAALKALRNAHDKAEQQRAVQALEKATTRLKEQVK